MGILNNLIGNSAAEPINAIGNVLDKLFTSDEEKEHAKFVLEKLKQHPAELQIEVNKIEAAHRSVFVAGWRPFIGWICGISLASYFIPQFLLGSYIWVKMCLAQNALLPYPVSPKGLIDLVLALLGLGALRTVEKFGNKTK